MYFVVALGFALFAVSAAFAADAANLGLRPIPKDLAALPPPDSDSNVYNPNLNWGVGILEPTASPEYYGQLVNGGYEMLREEFGEYLDWIAKLRLPLFDSAQGAQWGWLVEGQVVDLDSGEEFVIPRDARLRVSYDFETEALFVMREEDGWLQIRWGGAEDSHGGRAWTHPEFQSDPNIGAEYHSWEDSFRDTVSRLSYRNSEAVHLLRSRPSPEAAIVHRIEGRDWDMEILEMQGDWIRVRLSWPSDCSAGPREGEAVGWTVWRSVDQGPWIYSPIGGC
ncbi:MAG: hypothetical protein R3F50_01030 [Gammaproteobacteria bacterium]